ncbi:50S ribosomal protein L9 [Gulosibacter macacae]|uniref:Large ribosomal subunit protein bL9 n=1 Tax=Gulosibacter macacae TaxID=2488791 RepID=A0A3P3VYM6_9MICO|nr:50S ribosomal protein L9 [Gulosibacter macacae]RRJ86539.1 50S ribosomal protein L9 [Gulosibacter macacae]
MAKVILTHEVSGLGSAGDVIEVKNGFARNYLVPQGYAVHWTKGGEKQVEQIRSAREARELKTAEEVAALKQQLENALIKVAVKAGADGRLFGSVRAADIADAVKAQGIGEIDKRKVEFSAPVKSVGNHEATVRLNADVVATLKLQVIAAR